MTSFPTSHHRAPLYRALPHRALLALASACALSLGSAGALAQPTRRDTPMRTPDPKTTTPALPNIGKRVPPAAVPGGKAPGTPGTPGTPGGPTGATPGGTGTATGAIGVGPDIEFKGPPPGGTVNFNMRDADLPELVEAITAITGRRFIFGGKLRKINATVVSPKNVTGGEAYQAFLSVLEQNGMTVVPHGRYLKIVETAGAQTQTTEIVGTAEPVPYTDRYITRLYRLKHVDAQEASNILIKFKSKDGDITVYAPTNLLIITDTGHQIQRLLRITEELDAGGAGEQIYMQPVHHSNASDVAAALNEMLDMGSGAGRSKIIADDRNNNLVVVATEADYQRVLDLMKAVDTPKAGEGQIHVMPLQHAQCVELSSTLSQILGGAGGTARPAPVAAQRGNARAGTVGRATSATSASSGAEDGLFEGDVRVNCDEATNALVTVSSLRDFAQLRNVIDKLDQPRRQVFIEAVIMDVNVDHTNDTGIAFHGGATAALGGSGDTIFYGGSNPGQSLTGLPASLEALAFGVRGPDLDGTQQLLGTGVSIPAFGVVLHALAQSGDSNVLATPHILATDNIPAEISIGQNIPLQTNVGGGGLSQLAGLAGGQAGAAGALGALGGLGGFGFQAPRQDVGIRLNITPHINDSDQVRMEIQEEFSDAGSPTGALGAVPINKRTANTTVIVADQQTVVIGGLVREGQVNGETKIPVLGDIPVLGILFKRSTKQTLKTNLLLILTPHIIRDQNDLRRIFERKMQERQQFLDRYFVFEDSLPWEPTKDYSRTNGLLEHIRQTQLAADERERLAQELLPAGEKRHDAVRPIALPAMAGSANSGKATGAAPATPAARPRPRPVPKAGVPNRPNFRVPGGALRPGNRYRVE